jgi:hypothetical protein
MATASAEEYDWLYVDDTTQSRHDVLETLVEIVYEALNGISNKFAGFNDPFWMLAIGVIHDIFHSVGKEPDGITPFQQRLILKIIGKLKDNMNGFYPAILRVLLAAVGPYEHQAPQPNATAFNILKDAMYIVLRRLPKLADKKPRKLSDYFPPTVSYNVETKRITHTYRSGSAVVTDVSKLEIPALSLVKKSLRRRLTPSEIESARRTY